MTVRFIALTCALLIGASSFASLSGRAAEPETETGTKNSSLTIAELAPLPVGVTSFGAAIAAGHLYVYGGHKGSAHQYSDELQSNQLWRLNLAQSSTWELLGTGPRRTGLAMVAHGGKIYRVGGWEAKNAQGEEWDLHSQPDFARFDAKSAKWQDLPALPAGRSSHDAAVLGDKLFVVGGWELSGQGGGDWHATSLVCDLSQSPPQWKEIAAPPVNIRALAVAAWQGKVYAIGGMDDSNDTTTAMTVYDPESNAWSKGPKLPGKPMDGFGASAIGTPGGLFATTGAGLVCRLSPDGQAWQTLGKLNHPRMFHRLVADAAGRLLVIGGTFKKDKVLAVEAIEIQPPAAE
ncbi:MAG: hypothetical protein WD872_10600 [Pirellulaceae bacterium]